ncbi:YnjH family protein [Pseudoalteromonas shioyasakiensis]|uniref:YnjH family protein n=1 Tax=Pseudoalteromonas shioyasakiensis TaxID=1190813 RepID=A0ABT6TZ84_9GAMM|nr:MULTISPECIES: DUF1496 domain-containing protein [Pseudoalteromonas]MDI4668569.1 YnjH family protein [Pseudoalteromonas shioyasakiensis]MDI4673694.1 YnjH family protein [Pseudoalteromonas shioyasakiensis]MDI4685757.1 YnjH family protein [Pseudoalteromonas shioyasakiensis]MDI4703771.1 YnjH family protein [Pseudoalteromonas shioyasakiensis]NUJ20816.1 DUF1496 domain-containing protein [Pseudoalteromonas sp. 0802]
MLKKILLLSTLFTLGFLNQALAKEKPLIVLDGQEALNNQKVCWYENKRYTEGAYIAVGDIRLICTAKQPNFSNSDLAWLRLSANGEIIYPKQAKTIHVN